MSPNTLPKIEPTPPGQTDDEHERERDRREEGVAESEWLETDGRGGFAASTTTMTPSRRYHGLLHAFRPGTSRRHLFLAGLLERCVTPAGDVTLTRLRRAGDPDVVLPDGFRGTTCVPWPRTTFRVGALELAREVLMPREGAHATVLVRYELRGEGAGTVELELEPLLAFREADALTFANDVLRPDAEVVPGGIRFRPYETLPALTLRLDGRWEDASRWHRGVEYATDLARGYDGHEDLFAPGRFRVRLVPGERVTLAASVGDAVEDPDALFDAEAERRRAAVPAGDDARARFAVGADHFLYRGSGGRTGVLAGFPWFGEWGRDTFLALPGLTLARGRVEACGEILGGTLGWLADGLLPNIFGASPDDSHYGSADAALWFARAALLYQRAGGDRARVFDELAPALASIAEAYAAGAPRAAALGLRVDDAGLLHVGSPELNPTWMDARVAAGPVTPRHGYPVEIEALWCSLLSHLAELGVGDGWARRAEQARRAFRSRFWLEAEGRLADVWREDGVDASVRPNMILAAALELSPLGRAERARIVAAAETELLTPYGLRTLAPSDPAYRPRYGGGPESRDRAYHQGTVWPWLLGFFCEAALRADGSEARRARLRRLWGPLLAELDRGGLLHLSEVYDGEAPHRRGGTFAQAWNTAEALRALALLDGSLPLDGGGGS